MRSSAERERRELGLGGVVLMMIAGREMPEWLASTLEQLDVDVMRK